ncbi:MAG: type I restriction enzyme HsdR N-terminal domain-containing protein [Desulfatibacillaceae bacterium]
MAEDHHLVFGTLTDFMTGEALDDTYDERDRQSLGRLLVETLGFAREEVAPRVPVFLRNEGGSALVVVDYAVSLGGKIAMIVRYGPGSVVSRERPALAASRLVAEHQVPVVVVTNTRDASVLMGPSGKRIGEGMEAIPGRDGLARIVEEMDEPFLKVDDRRKELERRILYTFEAVGACNCDDC